MLKKMQAFCSVMKTDIDQRHMSFPDGSTERATSVSVLGSKHPFLQKKKKKKKRQKKKVYPNYQSEVA